MEGRKEGMKEERKEGREERKGKLSFHSHIICGELDPGRSKQVWETKGFKVKISQGNLSNLPNKQSLGFPVTVTIRSLE